VPHTILIADDHEEMRRLIVELLQAEGYAIRQAEDTDDVLQQLRGGRPDLLILDVNMPGDGGIAALRQIRADPALEGLPVLLLTGSVELAAEKPAAGADAQLPKPFPIEDLHSTVRGLLAG
jgi:CheY-like chemotaxis protein